MAIMSGMRDMRVMSNIREMREKYIYYLFTYLISLICLILPIYTSRFRRAGAAVTKTNLLTSQGVASQLQVSARTVTGLEIPCVRVGAKGLLKIQARRR